MTHRNVRTARVALAVVSCLLGGGMPRRVAGAPPPAAAGPAIALVPLGTGKGATAVYDGEPSSSFVITVGGKCRLLVDVGFGVSPRALRECHAIPHNVFVSHNHSDHAGELPVLLMVEATANRKLRVISAPEVHRRLVSFRIAELYSTGKNAADLADWVIAAEGVETRIDEDLSLKTYPGKHSETSYGFVLSFRGAPILGFSGDSGFDPALYKHLAVAPVMVLDARKGATAEHAGFDEIRKLEATFPNRIYITHYGLASEAPPQTRFLSPGQVIPL